MEQDSGILGSVPRGEVVILSAGDDKKEKKSKLILKNL
jgi:hypothetical protein